MTLRKNLEINKYGNNSKGERLILQQQIKPIYINSWKFWTFMDKVKIFG